MRPLSFLLAGAAMFVAALTVNAATVCQGNLQPFLRTGEGWAHPARLVFERLQKLRNHVQSPSGHPIRLGRGCAKRELVPVAVLVGERADGRHDEPVGPLASNLPGQAFRRRDEARVNRYRSRQRRQALRRREERERMSWLPYSFLLKFISKTIIESPPSTAIGSFPNDKTNEGPDACRSLHLISIP